MAGLVPAISIKSRRAGPSGMSATRAGITNSSGFTSRRAPSPLQPRCRRCLDRVPFCPLGNLAAGDQDLIHSAADLRHRGGENEPADGAPDDCAHAHHARFTGRIEWGAAQARATVLGQAAADRHHLAMGGRIVIGFAEIMTARNHLTIARDHATECIISLPRLIERHAHEALVVR
jgi:hypothetical protein